MKRSNPIFTGSAVAIITPFNDNGIDFDAFGKLIDFQIENNTSAIVVCGTTGEPSTMTKDEKAAAIKYCVEKVNKRVPVIAGTGSNNTYDAVQNSKSAYELGVDALLVVTPYYNKCTQKGIIEHYNEIAKATPLPIIAYNVPGRTGVNITPSTLAALAQIDTVCAIKEASGNIDQITNICALCKDKLDIYSGDDGIVVPMMSIGAVGVISVSANIIPKEMAQMCSEFFNNNIQAAAKMQLDMYELIKALFCEVNPIPVKTAAALMGMCSDTLRLPLTNMAPETLAQLKTAMKDYKLI